MENDSFNHESNSSHDSNVFHNNNSLPDNNSSHEHLFLLPQKQNKKHFNQKDIPEHLMPMFLKVKSSIKYQENFSINCFDMHCVVIHKQEKANKRWKFKCTLYNEDFRFIDYFMLHRGRGCPLFETVGQLNFHPFLEPLSSPKDCFFEQLAILSASCNISSRQVASPFIRVRRLK